MTGTREVELTGFSLAEVDLLIDEARDSSPAEAGSPEDEVVPATDLASAVTRAGDVWVLGRHRLICGDAQDPATFAITASRPQTSASGQVCNVRS